MAAKTAKMLSDFDISGKSDRLLMNKLRDCGLEYVSTSGKVIPAKTQPEHFCHCPQKCKSKLSQEKWDILFERFYNLADQNKQNQFLQSHILIKAVHLHNWEPVSTASNKRRVTCKYHVPNLSEDSELEDYINRKANDSIEVCQKAFMNCYGITEKRVRMQREKCISRLAPDHYKNSPYGKKHKLVPDKPETESSSSPEVIILENETDSSNTPLDLSNEKKRKMSVEILSSEVQNKSWDKPSHENKGKDQPLDLSNSKNIIPTSPPDAMKNDSAPLYNVAPQMAVPQEGIDIETVHKYEEYLRNLFKKGPKGHTKNNRKNRSLDPALLNCQTEIENRSPSLFDAAASATGDIFFDDPEISCIEPLNNGDITITPVSNSDPKQEMFEAVDIMRVNSFFQNQLWQPELIGLSSWH